VVKYGSHVDVNKGETMLYLLRTNTVKASRIFALFRNGKTQNTIMIMERMMGKPWNKSGPV